MLLPGFTLVNLSIGFVRGLVHWLCQRTGGLDGCVVVAFNLLDEIFREVLWPALLDDHEFEFPHIVVLGSCLSLVLRQPSQLVDVWMMKKYRAFQDTIQSGTNTLRPSSHLIVEDGLGDTMKLLQVKVQRVIRCALIADEFDDSCTWVFQTWHRALSGRLPLSIVTDQYKAMSPTFNCRSISKYGILRDVDTGLKLRLRLAME
ncbi:uncharacterized protein LOC131312407 isoform X2 [Rhododendron vialii]|uniref:uncharacterized protein LOC131312407 isoform X2 n=1 Tax=Rhododendron vialii TaxID=182163 RepID=UPI00265D9B17|nr:uncharacterized protein LOC131312407 isoform X2 [Rhododendron vialii]